MNPAVPAPVQLAAIACAVVVLERTARRLPWYKLEGDPEARRVLLLGTLALAGLRWFNADALLGSSLHFIGASAATLMFGPAFALWALAVASLLAWLGGTAWLGWGPDFIACGLLPVIATQALYRLEQARLPPNPVGYVLVNGFGGGALAMLASHLLKAGTSALGAMGDASAYLASAVPMMFGEGFLCGGTMALVVAYRPRWCASFDDARYLRPPS